MHETSRTFNAIRNMVFGIILKLFQTVVPFLMRTVMIYFLGIEYLGLNGLFVSVLQILNLAELGISQAMTFSMYQPIAEKDEKKICGLLHLYRRYYFYIGLIVLIIGMILFPFLPHLISGDVPSDINIYVLYVIYLATTVCSYWMFTYRSSLLEAHQRNDVISKIQLTTNVVQFIIQFVVLIIWRNYYLYIVAQLVTQIIYQFLLNYVVKKTYPEYEPNGEIAKEDQAVITQKVKDLATSKFGAVILNSGDTVVISAFLGLTVLAVYQNYFYIITSVIGFISPMLYGTIAGIGNTIVTESREKIYSDFTDFTFMLSWVVCVCTCCFFNLFQPFMELWVGKELLLSFSMVIFLCIYFYLYEFNQLFNLYKDAAGLWHKDRFRPLITSLANLTLNIILVQFMGLYGVILSTVISMLAIGMPWLLHNLFDLLFERSVKNYLKKLFVYLAITIASCGMIYAICNPIKGNLIFLLFIRGIAAVLVPSVIYVVMFYKTKEFRKMLLLLKKILLRKKI